MTNNDLEKNIAEIWALFRENREQLSENREQLELLREQSQETERLLREESLKTDRRFQESDRRFQETERLLREEAQKTEQQMRRTDQRISDLYGTFSNQWGRLMEALIEPDSVRLFQERGIEVIGSTSRAKRTIKGETMEIDILLTNSRELVIMEVKTQVSHEDVLDLLTDLGRFRDFFSEYRHYKLYGAIAGLDIPHQVSRAAYKRGLFVVGMTSQGIVEIKNDAQFRPKNFGFEPED